MNNQHPALSKTRACIDDIVRVVGRRRRAAWGSTAAGGSAYPRPCLTSREMAQNVAGTAMKALGYAIQRLTSKNRSTPSTADDATTEARIIEKPVVFFSMN